MQRQPLLGRVEVHVGQLERLAKLPAEGVAMHEGGARRIGAVVVVESKLQDMLQIRPMRLVICPKARELSLDEG